MKLKIVIDFFGDIPSDNRKVRLLAPCILCKYCVKDREYKEYMCKEDKRDVFALDDASLYQYGDSVDGIWCSWFKYKKLRKL